MTVLYKNFAINDKVTGTSDAAVDTGYTNSNGVGQITAATGKNTHTGSVTVHFYVLPSGVAATATVPAWSQEFAAGQSNIIDGLIGKIIPNLGSIKYYCTTTDVFYANIDGVEIVGT